MLRCSEDTNSHGTFLSYQREQVINYAQLQRVGRTGRKRTGYVHVLLSEGREEKNWDKAQSSYDEVQFSIEQCDKLEFYSDAERLLPAHIKPECVEMVMDIEEHVREDSKSRKGSLNASPNAKGRKRKRDDDLGRNVPPGALMGFVKAKDLVVKGTKKRKKEKDGFDPLLGEDDEDDLDIEAGLDGPRRTLSASAIPTLPKSKGKLKRTSTTIDGSKDKKLVNNKKSGKVGAKKGKKKATEPSTPTLSQFYKAGADDSDDNDIEKGLRSSSLPANSPACVQSVPLCSSPSVGGSPISKHRSSSREISCTADIIDLPETPDRRASNPADEVGLAVDSARKRPHSTTSSTSGKPMLLASSSPALERSSPPSSRGPSSPKPCDPDTSMAWLIADDDEPSIQLIDSSPVIPCKPELRNDDSENECSTEFVGDEPGPSALQSSPGQTTFWPPPMLPSSSSLNHAAAVSSPHQDEIDMPPPALPVHSTAPTPSPASDDPFPALTFAVRAPGRQTRKRPAVEAPGSSPISMPPPSQRRLRRPHDSSSPPPAQLPDPPASPSIQPRRPRKKKRVFRDYEEAQRANPWMDVEAVHSGDDAGEGSGGSDDDELGNESDRAFLVEELPETQVPSSSYDQSAVYRRSLFTQAPGSTAALPRFANRPAPRGREGRRGVIGAERRVVLSSSSPPSRGDGDGDEADEYVFGSFVVDDDAEISFMNDSSEA